MDVENNNQRANSNASQNDPKISITEEEKKFARGKIYGMLFKSTYAKLAILPSIITGLPNIGLFVICSKVLNVLIRGQYDKDYDALHSILIYSMYMLGISVIVGICKFFDSFLWMQCGSELSIQIRKNLFNKLMRTEVTFFDINSMGGILTLLSEDAQKVQDSFGPVKGVQIQNLSTFVAGVIALYVYCWKVGLIFTTLFLVIGIVIFIFMGIVMKFMKLKFSYLTREMTIAEEVFSSIRTIKSFNREDREIQRFGENNELSQKHENRAHTIMSFMIGTIMLFIWVYIFACLYYTVTLIDKGKDNLVIGDLFAIFGFCMNSAMSIIGMSSSGDNEMMAIESGARIIKLSEYEPKIQFEGGSEIEDFKGHIEFKNVSFKYPTRNNYVLLNVSFEIQPGQKAALVGHSGSGKSTCVQLLERFYDATEGIILLDNVDIRELDPRWLHRQIGLVSQEPVLFNTSIRNNILYGNGGATDEQIEEAISTANVKRFVDELEKGMNTIVGEKGTLLSGGQKQRIAIARAVIRNPVILITDEATSALDAENEKEVQIALDKVMANRTSVIVAHRLSTIKNANIIFLFESGTIKEIGTHESLLEKKGAYYKLVSKQLTNENEDQIIDITTVKNDSIEENSDVSLSTSSD